MKRLGGSADLADGAADVDANMENLRDGLSRLDEAASALPDSAAALNDGAVSLSAGAGELTEGIHALSEGLGNLQSGADQLDEGLGSLSGQSQSLRDGTAGISLCTFLLGGLFRTARCTGGRAAGIQRCRRGRRSDPGESMIEGAGGTSESAFGTPGAASVASGTGGGSRRRSYHIYFGCG